MSSVDNRIVNMHFNSNDFQAGAASASQALEGLETTIEGMSAGGSIEDMGAQVDGVASRFGALQIAGVAALATIAASATQTALSLGKNLIGSVTSLLGAAGFQRAIDLEQAAFQFRGLGLNVKEVMDNATEAVTGTAFALNEAATVATQFAGSGVKAGEDMTVALRGVSGVAAQTGKSYSEIGQIFAGVAGLGRVTTQDLMQFGVRGLDITEALAKQMGVTQDQVKVMVSEGQVDFKNFAIAMDTAFGKNAVKSNRTFTGALANMKLAVTRIGADFFKPILKSSGDVFNALGGAISRVQDALKPFSANFGRATQSIADWIVAFLESTRVMRVTGVVIQGFKNIFAPFVTLLQTVGDAWLQVFPSKSNQGHRIVFTLATAFELLTRPLAWLAEQIPRITPLFVAFFEILRVGWVAIAGIGSLLGDLVRDMADIGSNIVEGLMGGLTGTDIQSAIIDFANSIVEWIKGALGIASPASELIPVGISIVQGIAQGIANAVQFIWAAMGKVTVAVMEGFANLFGNMDALDWTALFNAILTGGLLLSLKKMADAITSLGEPLTTLTAPFAQMTDTLKTMQNSVRVQMITGIAIAVGILTASLIALTLLDPKEVAVGLGFLAAQLAILVGSMAILGNLNPEAIVAVSSSMILVSTAMLIMSSAVAVLGTMDLTTLAKGLGAMGIGLAILIVGLTALAGLGPGLPAAAFAMVLVAGAMTVLSGAIAIMGNLAISTLAKGLGAIAIGLTLFVLALGALTAMSPAVLASAASVLIVAEAMVIMAAAIAILGNMDVGTLAKGLGAIAIGLTIFVVALGALTALGPTVVASAAAILIISSAMVVLATAMGALGEMSVGELAKALGAMAIALTIFIAAAAAAMVVAPGLIALGASVALLGLGLALAGAGLLAAATAFSLFAAVGAAGIAVIIAAFNALLLLLPVIAVQLGTAFVVFIQAIAESAPKLRQAFGEIIKSALGTFRDAIPEFKKTAIVLIDALAEVVVKGIPKWGKVFEALIKEGLRVVRASVPEYVRTGVAIVVGVLQGLANNVGRMTRAATDLIVAFIRGMQQSANRIINAGADAVIDFLHGIADTIRTRGQEIRDAGWDIADAIIDGIVDGLQEGASRAVDAAESVAGDVVKAFAGPAGFFLGSPSKKAIYWGEMIVAGLVKGIKDNIKNAVGASILLVNAAISAGDKAIASAQREATKRQIAAEKAAARARIADKQAKEAEKLARQSPKNKDLQQAAKLARQEADRRAKAAADAQKKADAAAQRVSNVEEFRAADDQGKGDILTDRAEALSDRAIKLLAQAGEEAKAAKELQGKAREQMMRAARQDAAAAKRLAEASKRNQRRAAEFYAQAVKDRIKAIEDARAADAEELRLREELENATDAEKAEILKARSEADQARADAALAESMALIEQARKLAKTDAVKAQKLLDKAEVLAQQAKEAADKAEQEADEAQQFLDSVNGTDGAGSPLQLSRSAMEDAAAAIDRYTKSLQQAEEAAAASTPVYQFVQNNYSPESLSDAEIYRQSKNLLSAAEIKMGVPTPTTVAPAA